mgnify:CR=1 FL=1
MGRRSSWGRGGMGWSSLLFLCIGFLLIEKSSRRQFLDMIQKNKIFLVGGSLLAIIYIISNEPFVVEGISENPERKYK